MAVMTFSKEVHQGFGIRSWFQLGKVWGGDFGNVSCWMFGQKVNGVENVR